LVADTEREKRKLNVLENRVLRKMFGPKRDKGTREWENHITRNFMIYNAHQIFFGGSN
jgi:hypothetical protein